jgi:hypothetical protein
MQLTSNLLSPESAPIFSDKLLGIPHYDPNSFFLHLRRREIITYCLSAIYAVP